MKVIFFGTPEFAVPSLEKLLSQPGLDAIAVVTQPDKRRGRGSKVTASPIKEIALKHQIPVLQPRRIKKDAKTLSYLQQAQADAFAVVAYGQILSPEILAMPKLGCINVHGSLLPKYRGAAPIQRCLCQGETETGITTMLMDAGMDTGAMLLEARSPVGLLDNAQDLGQHLANLGADLLVETLLQLERQAISPVAQDHTQATYAPPIQKSEYRLDWQQPAIALHNQIRGLFPDCFSTFRGQGLKISATAPLGETYWQQLPPELQKKLEPNWPHLSAQSGVPGEIISVVKGIGPVVKTGDGLLLLRQVQLAGKRWQTGWDFANGTRLAAGEILGNSGSSS